jgi:hypothetical protein
MNKLHHFPAGAAVRASHTSIRIHPLWRCVCGRPVKASDVDAHDGVIIIDCPACFTRLFECGVSIDE